MGKKSVLARMRRPGVEINAENFAYFGFYGRDIEELGAEELAEIPDFLLDEWNAKQKR